jgi:hypothetical protein
VVARVKLHGKDPECVFFSVRELAPRHCLRHIRHLLERRARKDEICRTSIYSVHGARDGLWEGGTNSALVATTPLTRVANSGWQLAPSRSIESRRRHRLRVAMRKGTRDTRQISRRTSPRFARLCRLDLKSQATPSHRHRFHYDLLAQSCHVRYTTRMLEIGLDAMNKVCRQLWRITRLPPLPPSCNKITAFNNHIRSARTVTKYTTRLDL